MKDKWQINELTNMLIQEETRLKKIGHHSIYLTSQEPMKKGGTKPKKFKKARTKSCEPSTSSHAHEMGKAGGVSCHFCKKQGHFQKDCHKRRAWFEKKGIPYKPHHRPN